jgi:hypothetical protein
MLGLLWYNENAWRRGQRETEVISYPYQLLSSSLFPGLIPLCLICHRKPKKDNVLYITERKIPSEEILF